MQFEYQQENGMRIMKKSKRDKWDITLKASIPVFRDLEGEKEE
jgi:hypothetical protein